jgi:AraC family transcriptional regulator, regulatory protein of adaptative response / methylated-DNA-[protein]-cysteine methyltransferase
MKATVKINKETAQVNDEAFFEKANIRKKISETTLGDCRSNMVLEPWTEADEQLNIDYSFQDTRHGEILIASTTKGICYLGFTNNGHQKAMQDFKKRFPVNPFTENQSAWHQLAVKRMNDTAADKRLHLHLRGSAFQVKIWKRLMDIPIGGVATYGELRDDPLQARATGAAVGANPVGYLLACHRIVRPDGNYEGYHWGNDIKKNLLQYEDSLISNHKK